MDTPPFRTKAEHRVPLLLPGLGCRFCFRHLVKEAFDRVPPAGTGPVLKLFALPAGRNLGWQQRREVVLPERSVDLSRFEETLDMPCRVLHGVVWVVRGFMRFVYDRIDPVGGGTGVSGDSKKGGFQREDI